MIKQKTEIQFMVGVGVALEKTIQLRNTLREMSYSKHNPYFDSIHEIEANKLDDIRMKLSFINDELESMYTLLCPTFNEEEE